MKHWSKDQANRYISDIRLAITGLVEGTKIGRQRLEVSSTHLSYAVGAHVIFYRETEHLLVARVLHASMDLQRHLDPD